MQFTIEYAIIRLTSLFKYLRPIVSTLEFHCANSKRNAWIKLCILIYFSINADQMGKPRRYSSLQQIWKKNAIAIKASKDSTDNFFFILIVTSQISKPKHLFLQLI